MSQERVAYQVEVTRAEVVPVIDHAKCEGKSDCVRVCPESVFEVRTIDDADWAALSLTGKLRSWVHGKQTAYAPNAADCQACGLCVTACPETAIELRSIASSPPPDPPARDYEATR